MNPPLYSGVAGQQHRDRAGHAGLWYDKFCNLWLRTDGTWTMKTDADGHNPKLGWIESVANDRVGVQDEIEEWASRIALLTITRGGRIAVFATESRFVTGLGRRHPVENGFAWHATLGTPYLPGSSVKGLVRSWATSSGADTDHVSRLLGGRSRAGNMCFLDAFPVAPVRLEADVMTPHYAGWSVSDPPGDWRSPNPIPFLTTAPKTPFLFGIVPCRTVLHGDLGTVSEWLRNALESVGAGAKTAVGYGRFRHEAAQSEEWSVRACTADRQRREERERLEAMKSPEGRWRLELKTLSEAEVLDRVRIHLEKEPLEDPRERKAFASSVPPEFVGFWRQGKKHDQQTNFGSKKLKERARLVDRTLTAMEGFTAGSQ